MRMKAYYASYRNYLSCAPVGIDLINGVEGVRIFPNPVGDVLYVQANQPIQRFVIYDQAGRELFNNPIERHEITISMQPYASGVYYYIVQSSTGIMNGKLIKP